MHCAELASEELRLAPGASRAPMEDMGEGKMPVNTRQVESIILIVSIVHVNNAPRPLIPQVSEPSVLMLRR